MGGKVAKRSQATMICIEQALNPEPIGKMGIVANARSMKKAPLYEWHRCWYGGQAQLAAAACKK
jgi:hypothetical protein